MHKFRKKASRTFGVLLLASAALANCLTVLAADDKTKTQPNSPQYAYVTNQSVYFYDVAETYEWAFHEVDYLATLDIVKGTGDYLFEPELSISRADFVLMLCRAYDMGKYATGENFSDVPKNAYYYDAVLAAKNLGIASGSNGKFMPNAGVSREDAMLFLQRTAKRAGFQSTPASLEKFSDHGKVSAYAKEAVAALVGADVIGGDQNGKLNPKSHVTRAEMSVMLYRAMMMENGPSGAHYVAHPERINLCIGDKIYSSVIVANFDAQKSYNGLMELISFEQAEGKNMVRLGAQKQINQPITYRGGRKLMVGGKELTLAQNALPIQVSPYCALESFQSTGGEYQYGLPDINEKGEVTAVYYSK